MKKYIKAAVILLSAALFVACVAIYIDFIKSVGEKKEEMSLVQAQIDELRIEKKKLEKKLDKTDDGTDEEDYKELPKLSVSFRNISEIAYDEVYPLFMQKRLTASMVFLNNILPGSSGRISVDHAKEMHEDSWGILIGPGKGVDFSDDNAKNKKELKSFMQSYSDKFKKELGFKADGIYFMENTYKADYNSVIKELGFTTVFYEGNYVKCEDKSLIVVHVQNNPSNDDIINTYENGQVTGYRIDLEADNNTGNENFYSKTNMNAILSRIANGKRDGLFEGCSFEKLGVHDEAEPAQTAEDDTNTIRERIEQIDREIRNIYLSE